jgi:DNA-binding transcriptional LysR family regulator
MALYPEAKIDLEYARTTRIVREVLAGATDLGVVAYPEKKRGLSVIPLGGDRLVLICPPDHPFASRKKVKATDLRDEVFVHFERDIPTRRATERVFRAHGVTVRRAAEFDNIETIKRAVEVGFGLAIVPQPSVVDERRHGQLAVVQLAEPEWTRTVGVIHRSDRTLSTSARKFIELLRERESHADGGARARKRSKEALERAKGATGGAKRTKEAAA